MNNLNSDNEVLIHEVRIICELPVDASKIDLCARVYDKDSDNLLTVSKEIDRTEILQAFVDYYRGYFGEEDSHYSPHNNFAIVYIPENTVSLTISSYTDSEEPVTAIQTFEIKDIQVMLQDAEDNYVADDDRFALTQEGREYLNQLKELNHEQT